MGLDLSQDVIDANNKVLLQSNHTFDKRREEMGIDSKDVSFIAGDFFTLEDSFDGLFDYTYPF